MSVAANMAEIMDIYSYTLKYVSFLGSAGLLAFKSMLIEISANNG